MTKALQIVQFGLCFIRQLFQSYYSLFVFNISVKLSGTVSNSICFFDPEVRLFFFFKYINTLIRTNYLFRIQEITTTKFGVGKILNENVQVLSKTKLHIKLNSRIKLNKRNNIGFESQVCTQISVRSLIVILKSMFDSFMYLILTVLCLLYVVVNIC